MDFDVPSLKELGKLDETERMNAFRRYFASSRYLRLHIQQALVRSAYNSEALVQLAKMEKDYFDNFSMVVSELQSSPYMAEFILAAKEEELALQKIIEAYNRRMSNAL